MTYQLHAKVGFIASFATLSLLGCDFLGSGQRSGVVSQEAQAAGEDTITVVPKVDGRSAVSDPAPQDKGWKLGSYDPLAPARKDGKPTFSNTWFTMHIDEWSKLLAEFKGKPNLRYLEVGVFEGQSLLWVFENILTDPSSRATAIDVFEFDGLESRFRDNLARAGLTNRVEIAKGYSNITLRPLTPNSYDIIYIDGSHSTANVLRDAILSWDLLKTGGILIFDDYNLRSRYPAGIKPGLVVDVFVTAFQSEVELLHRGWQLALKKRQTDCLDLCSPVGPYYYYWSSQDDSKAGMGVLYDPRVDARVPLDRNELIVLEKLIASTPLGYQHFQPLKAFWEDKKTQGLMRKLDLL